MTEFTPVQWRMLMLLGARKKYHEEPDEDLPREIFWIMEALRLLLTIEFERMAIADNVDDLENLSEALDAKGLEELNRAGKKRETQ